MQDRKHGSPYDRGSADSYYRRPRKPHYFPNGTGRPPEIEEKDMTSKQITEYHLGFTENNSFKEY